MKKNQMQNLKNVNKPAFHHIHVKVNGTFHTISHTCEYIDFSEFLKIIGVLMEDFDVKKIRS